MCFKDILQTLNYAVDDNCYYNGTVDPVGPVKRVCMPATETVWTVLRC